MKRAFEVLVAATAFVAATANGHGTAADDHETAFGHPGDPAKVTRTIDVNMTDAMRFSPARLVVKKGETVRFIVHNRGKIAHEMVLGTDKDLRDHGELMRRSREMEHADPNMVHVDPGAQAQMVWTFDQAGHFAFACLVPGHFEAGMKGAVEVR